MASGNTIRGSRVGSGPARLTEYADEAPRRTVRYWCAQGHVTTPSFASDVAPPAEWECPHCGCPAGQDADNPPAPPRAEPYKTHLAYVKERRSDSDAAVILAEALARVPQRQGG
ncbi:RNA polymerase-binding protein RbpA [Planosporangium sp. 12N6]|uniref:RNA polymerase-binding protein RbpA n=1 Tax=Planosporangium spinosum TaxID=3402278 RepID=UPI003CEFE2A6